MNTKLKVLLHTPDFPPWDGGIAAAAFDIAKYLTHLGHQVIVVSQNLTENDQAWDKNQVFKIVRVKNISSSIVKYQLLKWKTKKIVTGFNPDILFAFSWRYSGLVCSYIKNKTNIPLIQFYHGNEIFDRHRKKKYWENLFIQAQKNTDLSLANSHYTADALKSTLDFPVNVTVMPLGVDLEYFVPPKDVAEVKSELGFEGKKIILTLARIVERKKHMTVINALPELIKVCPNVLYVIAGRGDYQKTLEHKVASLGLQQHVKFVGFVSNEEKLKYYQACDVYVMPSKSSMKSGDLEGFGLTYLEANACGKPAIGGNQGGVLDAIVEGVNGYLVEPDDSVALFNYLSELFLNEGKYNEMSYSSLEYVRENCSWRVIVNKLVERFNQTLLHVKSG